MNLSDAKRIASRHPALRRKAEQLAEAMRVRAADHIDTGQLFDSIEVNEVELPDSRVRITVSMARENLTAIEYGHPRRDGSYQPGLHIMSGAIEDVKGMS